MPIQGQEFTRGWKRHRDAQNLTDPFKSNATEETQCPGLWTRATTACWVQLVTVHLLIKHIVCDSAKRRKEPVIYVLFKSLEDLFPLNSFQKKLYTERLHAKMLYIDPYGGIYRAHQGWVWVNSIGTSDLGHHCLPHGNLQPKLSFSFGRTRLSSTPVKLPLFVHCCPKTASAVGWSDLKHCVQPSHANGIIPMFKNEAHAKAASLISLKKSFHDQATCLITVWRVTLCKNT